jgi:hypothetical protein
MRSARRNGTLEVIGPHATAISNAFRLMTVLPLVLGETLTAKLRQQNDPEDPTAPDPPGAASLVRDSRCKPAELLSVPVHEIVGPCGNPAPAIPRPSGDMFLLLRPYACVASTASMCIAPVKAKLYGPLYTWKLEVRRCPSVSCITGKPVTVDAFQEVMVCTSTADLFATTFEIDSCQTADLY